MIKIWQKTSEGKSSWPALLGAVLSVFCCFLFSGNAKAAVEIGNYTSGGAMLSSNPVIATSTIPTNCTDPLVVFQILLDYSSGQITSILWDDETTANNIPNQALFTGNYFGDYIYYATSTTPGDDITFYFNRNATGGWWNYAITTFCGVDQNNPVGNLVKKEGNLDYNNILTATSTESSSAIYAAYFKIAGYHQTWLGISPNDFTEQARTGLDWMSSFTALDLPGDINGNIYDYDVNFTNNNQIFGNWTFAALPINAGESHALGSIYWAGVGTQALYKGEVNRIPFYYNICADWETYKSYDDELWVEIKQEETQIASSSYVNFRVPLYDNSECKGFRYISMDSGLVNIAASGTMDIILRNDPATSTEKIYGQNTFFYNYDWRDGLTYFNRLFNSPLIIPQKTGTSTITFEYGFNELNVDRVCWFNEDWQVLNTDICTSTDQIDNEGIGGLDLPNQITKTIYKGSFAAVDTSNNILLKTEPFQIAWANDWKDAFSEIASSTDDSLLKLTGLSAHDLACTQEEWAESTESWFNWQKLKCNSLYSMFFAGEVITNAIKAFIKTTSDIILTMFPLNIPANIIRQWNLSEGKDLPTGLEMLTPQDSEGNIYITLSPELAGATSTIQIWGEEIYYATPGLETLFDFIKELTRILLWILVLVEIIGIGFQILKDINNEEDPDFELSSIHYDSKGQYSASYRPKK